MDRGKLQQIIPFIAEKFNFRLETIEKDYYLTLILNNVESHLSNKIVFKGGTLLNKIHLNYHRLSEDIDFTYFSPEGIETRSKRSRAITPIREKMPELLKLLDLKSKKPEGEGFNKRLGNITRNFLVKMHINTKDSANFFVLTKN